MRPQDYLDHDATGLAALLRRGEVSPLEVVDAAIERIEALNPTLNAVVERADEAAREAAAAWARSPAPSRPPLAGVPFLAKDLNIEVAGLHLTASCRYLGALPAATRDAPLAARWRAAGLAILGRTNTPEFAAEFVTEPTWRGATRNPWDLARSPGGSSGGAAAAVAAGMVPLAHGTDSGGSIRVPAGACGLVGLKPSRGLTPVGPHLDELAGGLDVEHVLTRSIRDSARLLALTAGPEPTSRTPFGWEPASLDPDRLDPQRLGRLTIGITLSAPGGARPNEEIGAAVERVGRVLAAAGHRLVPFEFPASAAIGDAALVVWLTAIAEEIEFYRQRIGREPAREELEALTWKALEIGRASSAVDYVRARRALTRATLELAEAWRDIDVLLLPATAEHAPRTGAIDGRSAAFDFARWNAESYGYAPYTEIFNVSGQPALVLPLASSAAALPIGVQLAARLGEDARLLALGAWLEREQPWESRQRALRQRFL